jgi:carboxymethylenebutenolidase
MSTLTLPITCRASGLAVVAALCSGCASTWNLAADGTRVAHGVEQYRSGDRTIAVDHYSTRAPGRRPAVILIHGSGGLWFFGRRTMARYATSLAARGFETFVVHYFDATGSLYATGGSERRNFARWVTTLSDAVTYASREPAVDSSRIGVMGVSLGAFLAVGVAAEDRRIGAIVGIGGGLEPFLAGRVTRLPPALILHGDHDRVVPISEAYALALYLSSHDLPFELRIYPGEGHQLDSSEADALARSTEFLLRATSEAAPQPGLQPAPHAH